MANRAPLRGFDTLLAAQHEPRFRTWMFVREAGVPWTKGAREVHDAVLSGARLERQWADRCDMLDGVGGPPVRRGNREQPRATERPVSPSHAGLSPASASARSR